MLKTSVSTKSTIRSSEGVVRFDGKSSAGCDGNKLEGSEIVDIEIGGGKINNKVRKEG